VQDSCLIFLHLPKTGGSTLTTLLRWQYRSLQPAEIARFITEERTFEEIDRLPLEQRARIKLLVGHFAYGVHEFIPKPCSYITIVREPAQRVVSLYRYILSAPSHHLHKTLSSSSMSLEDYIGSGIHQFQTENALTRQLAGRDEEGDLTAHDLEIAKRNLRSCRAVGLTEAFDESVTLFKRILAWGTPFYFNRNVSRKGPRSDEVAATTLELIRERNAFDVELYEVARCQFNFLVEQHGPGFDKEVNRFKLLNRIPQALGGVLDPIAPMIRRGLERRALRRSAPA
jgi:Galactose-3-O-sulfotransferase